MSDSWTGCWITDGATHTHTHSVAQRYGVGFAIYRLRVQFPASPLSCNIGQLSLASFQGRKIEYLLRLGVKAGFSPLSGGR